MILLKAHDLLDLESTSVFDLMIHDVYGKLVYTKNNNKLSKGTYVYPIDLSQNVAGTYVVSLKSNNNLKTIKIIKQ